MTDLHEHRALLLLRVTGMLILLALLIAAFVPTSSLNWVAAVTQPFERSAYDTRGWYALNVAMPVKCFWQSPFDGRDVGDNTDLFTSMNTDAPFTYLLLILPYGWKVSSLVRNRPRDSTRAKLPHDDAEHSWFKRKILRWLLCRIKVHAQQIRGVKGGTPANSNTIIKVGKMSGAEIAFRLALITYTACLAAYDFLASFLASIWVLTLLLIWGTLELVNVRNTADSNVHREENKWGFGQVLPMVLLAAPLVAMVNHFMRKLKS